MPRLMKTTTAFAALQARRQNESNAKKNFMVRPLTKAGVPSRSPLTQADWQFNAFVNREDADARVVESERLNPGKKFVVTPV